MRQILIVDDEIDLARLLAEELERVGHRARVAADGAEGLAYLRNAVPLPELILLDLEMPVMDGYRFREEQRRHARWRRIPVVAISAVSPRHRPTPDRLDVQGWLRKPFDIAVLLDVVRGAPLQV
ncbi:MAG TPA: response regulator [Myxococcales bacterium]|nr:response regulator [Myxococcales bacterium]